MMYEGIASYLHKLHNPWFWPCRDRCESPRVTQLQSSGASIRAWLVIENHHVAGNLVTLHWDTSLTRGHQNRKCRATLQSDRRWLQI